MTDEARSRLRFFWRSSLVLTAANFLASLLNLGFQVLMGRLLSKTEFGLLQANLGLVGMVTIAVLAASQAVTHHVARYHAQQNMAEVDRLKKASSAFLFYLTLGGSVLALLIIKPLTGFFHVPRAALTMAEIGRAHV